MRQVFAVVLAGALGIISARAAGPSLIVTKAGQSFSASTTRTKDATVFYISDKSTTEHSLPEGDVEGIIPVPQRGSTYTDQEIATILETIDWLKKKHPGLRRQINSLESDWIQAQNPMDPAVAAEIDAAVTAFNEQPTSESVYKRAKVALQMIRYKDKTGVNDAKIDKILIDMHKSFLGFDLPALTARGDAKTVDRDQLKVLEEDVKNALQAKLTPEEKVEVQQTLVKARTTAIRGYVSEVETFFDKYKAISVYHKGVEQLRALAKELARTNDDVLIIKTSATAMFETVKKSYPDYDFSYKNFPISPIEQTLLKTLKPFSSIEDVKGVQEECYMIPRRLPIEPISFVKPANLPFTLLFNREQPEGREFNIVIEAKDAEGATILHASKLPTPKFVNGRAGMLMSLLLTQFPAGSQPMTDEKGTYVRLYLTARAKDNSGQDSAAWVPISKACHIPVSLPEKKE